MNAAAKTLIGLFAVATVAQSGATAATNTTWATITRVNIDDDTTAIFIDETIANPASCANSGAMLLENTTGNYEAITSAILTAFAGGFEASFRIDESNCATGGYVKAEQISIRPAN